MPLFFVVSAFSPGVSGWFSRFFHLGLDDNERERERERERETVCVREREWRIDRETACVCEREREGERVGARLNT